MQQATTCFHFRTFPRSARGLRQNPLYVNWPHRHVNVSPTCLLLEHTPPVDQINFPGFQVLLVRKGTFGIVCLQGSDAPLVVP